MRKDLDFVGGSVQHLHIFGPPGVGKTRLALELCRNAPWREYVIYVRQAADVRLVPLIDSTVEHQDVRLTIVADEVQQSDLFALRDAVERGNGRIRLITIGHSPSPEPNRIAAFEVKPLEQSAVRKVVNGWYPSMPIDHAEFVAKFADGYMKLARIAADAVEKEPGTGTLDLLGRFEIRSFLDRMLGTENRRPLHVVAALASVGWADDMEGEGKAIAEHLGLSWIEVKAAVEVFDSKFAIAPRSGRFRYISPKPLGIHLAAEAWSTYPELMEALPDKLPTTRAVDAFHERLTSISANPHAKKYGAPELRFFFRLGDLVDEFAARRWAACVPAAPEEAASRFRKMVEEATLPERRSLKDRARREIIWTLVRLAWRTTTFDDAVFSLALLAEAENEKWANNSSGEFVARYQIFLGGTAVSYFDRMYVIDELLALDRSPITSLVIRALSEVADGGSSRMNVEPITGEVPEREWHPASGKEHFDCVQVAIKKLCDIVRVAKKDQADNLVIAASKLLVLLGGSPLSSGVKTFLSLIRERFPGTRESLRRMIAHDQRERGI